SSTIVLHTKHAAIDRRSPLRIPSMLIDALSRPYSCELDIGAGREYALLQPPKSDIQAAAKHRCRSKGSGRVACGAFRVDRLCGYRVTLQAEGVVEQAAYLHSPAELVAGMAARLKYRVCGIAGGTGGDQSPGNLAVIPPARIVQRCRRANEAPRLVEAQVKHGIEELLPLDVERVGANPKCPH